MEDLNSAAQKVKCKFVILGNAQVGKSSILAQFVHETFDSNYRPSIGVEFISKKLYRDGVTVLFELWDTSSNERFRSLIPRYIRNTVAAAIVFDVTNRQSFDSADEWIEMVKDETGAGEVIVLVGNKVDQVEERCVTSEEAAAKASEKGAMYIEVSAKTGGNIKSLFALIAEGLAAKENPRPQSEETSAPTQQEI